MTPGRAGGEGVIDRLPLCRPSSDRLWLGDPAGLPGRQRQRHTAGWYRLPALLEAAVRSLECRPAESPRSGAWRLCMTGLRGSVVGRLSSVTYVQSLDIGHTPVHHIPVHLSRVTPAEYVSLSGHPPRVTLQSVGTLAQNHPGLVVFGLQTTEVPPGPSGHRSRRTVGDRAR